MSRPLTAADIDDFETGRATVAQLNRRLSGLADVREYAEEAQRHLGRAAVLLLQYDQHEDDEDQGVRRSFGRDLRDALGEAGEFLGLALANIDGEEEG